MAVFTTRCMGSPVRLTVLGSGRARARAARDAAWAELTATDEQLSRFRSASDLSRANQLAGSGAVFRPVPRLRRMIATAERARRVTEGRFDARVITDLEALGERAGVPLPRRATTSGSAVAVRGRGAVELLAPLDSGGLGKGLGLRWALRAAGRAAPTATGILLDAGGDIAVAGSGPGGGAWSIGIENPLRLDGEPLAVFGVEGPAAVATTSVAVRHWEHEGRTVHHLIDPARGQPASSGLLAVTVLAADPAWAEIRTKSLFIAGRQVIGQHARAAGWAVWWVEEDGSFHMTPAARTITAWTADEARSA